jgi:hypothetical protein
MIAGDADDIRRKVRDGELDPGDADQVLRFAAFLRNAAGPTCVCDKGRVDAEGQVIPHAHVSAATLAYARGEDVDPEGTEHL